MRLPKAGDVIQIINDVNEHQQFKLTTDVRLNANGLFYGGGYRMIRSKGKYSSIARAFAAKSFSMIVYRNL